MKALVVLAHPEPKSINRAQFQTAVDTLRAQDHVVATRDFYRMGFNPVADHTNFSSCTGPGVRKFLKGWADRTFAMGWADGPGWVDEQGMFWGKRAGLSLTTGWPPEVYGNDGFYGVLRRCRAQFSAAFLLSRGFGFLRSAICWQPLRVLPAERDAWLDAWVMRLQEMRKEVPMVVGRGIDRQQGQ